MRRDDDDGMALMYNAYSQQFKGVAESSLRFRVNCPSDPDHLSRDEEINELDHLSARDRVDLTTFMEALAGEYPPAMGPQDGEMARFDVPAESLARGCGRSAL